MHGVRRVWPGSYHEDLVAKRVAYLMSHDPVKGQRAPTFPPAVQVKVDEQPLLRRNGDRSGQLWLDEVRVHTGPRSEGVRVHKGVIRGGQSMEEEGWSRWKGCSVSM